MQTVTNNYKIPWIWDSALEQYFGSLNPCILDIEATGLAPMSSELVMCAMLIPTAQGIQITQYFAESLDEEGIVLQKILEFLDDHMIDMLISYNGLTYDIPYINKRLEILGIDSSISLYNFDLYRFFRFYTVLKNQLPSLSQNSIEEYYGILQDRRDTIDGGIFPEHYATYQQNRSELLLEQMYTHNREDVYQLFKIFNYASRDGFSALLNSGDIHFAISNIGFPSSHGEMLIEPYIKGDSLVITGKQLLLHTSLAYFEDGKSVILDKQANNYQITVPLHRRGLDIYVDAVLLGVFEDWPSQELVNGFIILSQDGQKNNAAIAALSKLLVDKTIAKYHPIH